VKLSLGVALLVYPAALSAQTVPTGPQGAASGQVERSLRRVEEPPLERPLPRIELPGRASRAAADDAREVTVARVVVTGAHALSLEEIRPALPGEGERTRGELRDAAERVTALYRSKGYPLAFATVPELEPKDGVVEIRVVEKGLDRVVVAGNEHFTTAFILDYVREAREPASPRIQDLERGLLLLNENPSLRVRAEIRKGETPGSTELLLTAEDAMPLTLSFDADNFGSETVGETRAGATVGFHDLWDQGHELSLRGRTSMDSEDGEVEYGRVEYAAPFPSGTRLTLHGAFYEYEARNSRTVLDPTGDGTVFGGALSHAFLRGFDLSLWGDVGLELKDLRQELVGFEVAHDELRILILGLRAELADGGDGRWVASLQYRQGLGDVAGGLGDDDPEASRPGADGAFSMFTLRLHHLRRVLRWFHLVGKVDAQYSSETLVISEQFVLGGHDSVRGYPPFEFMGDRGYTASLEARFKLPFLEGAGGLIEGEASAFDIFQVAAFVDTGEMIRERPFADERRKQVLTGGGVGFLVDYPGALRLRLDVAWPLTDLEPSDGDDVKIYFSVVLNLR
jgi:hemolysin activation/secretion protein